MPPVLSQTILPTTSLTDLLPVTTPGSHSQRPRGRPTKATGAPLGAGALIYGLVSLKRPTSAKLSRRLRRSSSRGAGMAFGHGPKLLALPRG
jgi:hypothetical protein